MKLFDTQVVFSLVCFVLVTNAVGAETVPCEPVGDMTPHCGFRNPEDLKKIPGHPVLVVSEMGEMVDPAAKGTLSVFEIEPPGRSEIAIDLSESPEIWADPSCPLPSHLNPHGIDLVERPDGRLALWVVNHGGRESIEVFELSREDETWTATWRGCAIPPGEPFLNDVAGLTDGGFVTTHMWDQGNSMIGVGLRFLLGMDTGFVWEWSPETGFAKLEGTDGSFPNGIAVSKDGRYLFVNRYMGGETTKYDRVAGETVAAVEIRQPDNVTIDGEGHLWVPGHHQSMTSLDCGNGDGPCLWQYSVMRIDPSTMKGEVVIEHEGPPMGFATVALVAGDTLYLGSALGDRIVSMPVPGK